MRFYITNNGGYSPVFAGRIHDAWKVLCDDYGHVNTWHDHMYVDQADCEAYIEKEWPDGYWVTLEEAYVSLVRKVTL